MQKSSTNSDRKVYCADALLAAEKGQEALAKYLSDNHITIDYYYNDARPLLKSAILEVDGYTDRLRTILSFNPNFFLMSKDKWQETAIHTAARINKPEYLKVLLEAAKKKGQLSEALNSKDGRGNTPLAWACTNREEGMIDILLGYGADATIPNLIGKQPIDFLTDHPNLAQKVQAQIEKQKQQKTSAATAAVTQPISHQSSAVKPDSPHPVSAAPQEIKTKQPIFKFDQVDINRARLEMKLTDSGMVMYLKGFTNYKKHGHKLLNPEQPSFAKVYVVLEHLILSLDLEKIVELEKILDDEAEMLWQSGFDSSKSYTFSNILHTIKLPGPVADQNGLSSEDFARSKLLPWFDHNRNCPAIVRIYGEDDFEKSIKTLSKNSAPSDAVVQMIKRKVDRTYNLAVEQSEAVKEYVSNRTQPQQQAQSSGILVPPLPPKPVQRRNSMERTQSPTTFFGPARQKTPSPPQGGSLSGSPDSDEVKLPLPTGVPEELQRRIDEQLIAACKIGALDVAENLLKNLGANPDAVTEMRGFNVTPLFLAILTNHKKLVALLLDYNADINFGEATPLQFAISIAEEKGNELTLYLLERGANPNVCSPSADTYPIHDAVNWGNIEIINALVKHGADVNFRLNEKMPTPLMCAVCSENLATVKWLVEHGADVSLMLRDGIIIANALGFAGKNKNKEIYSYLKSLDCPKVDCAQSPRFDFKDHNASGGRTYSEPTKCLVM